MKTETSSMGMSQEVTAISNKDIQEGLGLINLYHVTCYDSAGNFKWKETIKNLVTDEGLNYIINAGFLGSPAAISAWYVGLKDTGAPASTDAASALPNVGNWTEYTEYLDANNGDSSTTRPTLTLADTGTGQVDNSASVATYTIETPGNDVYGVFVVDSNNKGGSSGATVLYGVGDFASAKVVDTGDTLNVTVTLTATSGA